MSKSKRTAEAVWWEEKNLWHVRVQRDGRRKSFYSPLPGRKGKHEAEAKADAWLETGTEDMRMSEAWKEFLEDVRARTGTSNFKKTEIAGRIYILPVTQLYKLSAITVPVWQKCINAAADKGRSRRYCKNIRDAIMAFLEYARRSKWTYQHIEAKDITIPNAAAPAKSKRIMQPDDVRTLFACDTYSSHHREQFAHYIYAWRLLVATGLRRGELVGLRWEDVDDTKVSVRRSINEQGEETHGKNDNARRTFLLTDTARSILNDQRDYMKSIGVISPWIFPDESGNRTDPHSLYKRWTSYSSQHGFKTSLHELRHTFVSINKAMPVELMKAVVGHSTDMDTYGVYGHDVDGDAVRAAEIIDGVFERIFSAKP